MLETFPTTLVVQPLSSVRSRTRIEHVGLQGLSVAQHVATYVTAREPRLKTDSIFDRD